MKFGTVYLVGAGPGDPGLLTLRGAECLRRADVVIYDRLAHPDHLRHAPEESEKVYVGKASAQHSRTQDEINALLIEHAKAGKTVCRLKGGDPFVFGRGGEEAEICRAEGIPFEIVPGVTSAIAAPAYAGIPVTHRDAASSFAVITGHERDDARESGTRTAGMAEGRRNWAHIAHAADTLVFLMGVENIGEIAARLIENGRASATPVALVRWGTWPQQETLVSTLASVVEDVKAAGFKAPAVTVVGEVVRLRDTLRWFDTRPLFGKRILVTRAREQASALSNLLREAGAEPVEFPVIKIVPHTGTTDLDALSRLPGMIQHAEASASPFDWVVFTSANAVYAVSEWLESRERDARAFGRARVAAIGPATADALKERMGLRADFVPSQFVAEAVVAEWPEQDMTSQRVLLPRAKEARELLPDRLTAMGAIVEVVTAYETVRDAGAAEVIRAQLQEGKIDAITFTSSSTVKNFIDSIGSECIATCLSGVLIACIGPITADTAREMGITPSSTAEAYTIPGLVDSLITHFTQQ